MSENKTKVHDLSFFLPSVVEEAEEVTAPISKRFKDKEGNIVPFIFKAIPTERIDALEKECTTYKNVKGQGRVKDFDTQRFYARVAIETTVYPNFRSKELREAYKTEDGVEVAKKVLSVGGEYNNFIAKTMEVNGFDDTIDDLEEAAKNS
jgi:Phage XkdN-like tail assembly chaperone protein, TAC